MLELSAPHPLDRREQPLGIRRVPKQVGSFGYRVVVVFRQDHRVSVPGDDLDNGVVIVDLLDEPEQTLSCFRRGYCRHDRLLVIVLDSVPLKCTEEEAQHGREDATSTVPRARKRNDQRAILADMRGCQDE